MDWTTVASLVTAATTLVLAIATFMSVRSGNRTAAAAERALQVNLRPLLGPSRLQDPDLKAGFADEKWFTVHGSSAAAEVTDNVIYFVMSLRNSGTGIAVLHAWHFLDERPQGLVDHSPLDSFRRLTRDIYIAGGDIGFWQGAIRDVTDPQFSTAAAAINERRRFIIEVLYGDHEGGQRTVSLFSIVPRPDGGWFLTVARHWHIDGSDPR